MGLPYKLEERIELAYWEMDDKRQRNRPGGPMEPRDAFKWTLRELLAELLQSPVADLGVNRSGSVGGWLNRRPVAKPTLRERFRAAWHAFKAGG